ncbi:MAG: class I SAM-dependent methyltransferase [Bacilli bacterium]|nr:class I SAM-dependent methyltransferase [Bacilli bacterium]
MKVTNEWNRLDNIIASIRYSKVKKYIPFDGIIVDIGCGQKGDFLMRSKKKIRKGYGIDLKIDNKTIDNIEFINNVDMKKFPIKKESIDVVFLNAVLEHLHDPRKILKDCLKLLKPNGLIVLTTPAPCSKPLLEFMAYKLHIINELEIQDHVHYYSKKDIKKLVKKLSNKATLIKYRKFELGLNSIIVIKKNA